MTDDGPPYPDARRTYRLLGLIHAPLFGAIVGTRAYEAGYVGWAIVGFLVAAALTYGVFHRLAEDHYHGNVPGKPGSLVYGGEDE